MMKRFPFLALIFICFGFYLAKADSPLTSTYFAKAYLNESIVAKASESNGILTSDMMEYLAEKENPVDIKLALINELGWDIDGKNNAQKFLLFLQEKNAFEDREDFNQSASADLLICMAYLMALDDYFDVSDAAKMAGKARESNNESYALNLIAALIQAQDIMDESWCMVFRVVDAVRQNGSYTPDLRPEAEEAIFEYIEIYESSCP